MGNSNQNFLKKKSKDADLADESDNPIFSLQTET